MFYVGFDSSTQSISVVVIEAEGDRRSIVFECSLSFDEALPHYGTTHGVLPNEDPTIAVSPPLMWVEALDLMLARLAASGLDLAAIAAISGSAQQHGSVYLSTPIEQLRDVDPARPLVEPLRTMLARDVAPIWMDSSTSRECAEISSAVGGTDVLAQHTGSRAFERFTAAQIRKFSQREPAAYAATTRIDLVSSFLCSLLVGAPAPLDAGDASGMNLMDLSSGDWWPPALDATAPDLARRLPRIVPAWTIAGTLAPYWGRRYGLPPARVVVWSGDNPSSMIGTGLVHEGRVAVSLGTSDTIFGAMHEPRVDSTGTGHVFGSPTGEFMGLTCFKNGSLARERVRDAYGLTWQRFSEALAATPPGNGGRLMLPWFEPEITPTVLDPGVRRHNLPADDAAANVRAVVEAQAMAMARHSAWMGVQVRQIVATGGASVNREMLQIIADVFGAEVYQSSVTNSAALGAALRALHGDWRASGREVSWDDTVRGLTDPDAPTRIQPHPDRHQIYRALLPAYAAFESQALTEGPQS
jgi:xylulokinase